MRARHSASSRVEASKSTELVRHKASKEFAKLNAFLTKKYKGEVFTTIASGSRAENIEAVPSGWREIDDLITGETDKDARTIVGSGLGWPKGRIIEIYGPEGVGKTTLALHIISVFQARGAKLRERGKVKGELCAFVDAEHALDVTYAAKLDVDLSDLMLSQPENGGEQALDIITSLCKSGLFGCVVVDSVAALTPLAELQLDFEDSSQPGIHARLMSRALRKLASVVKTSGTLLVFLNQTRTKIGVRYGNPNTTTGGNALKFYASIRLEMTVIKTQKKGDRVAFRRTRIRTVKNKIAPPFREVFADVVPNKGIVTVHGESNLEKSSDEDEE